MELQSPTPVQFEGSLYEPADLSGVACVGKFLVVASDEGHAIQILKQQAPHHYQLIHKFILPEAWETDQTKAQKPELDLESVTTDGNTVYVIGSHSSKRQKVDLSNRQKRSYKENWERLGTIKHEKDRRVLFKFKLDKQGNIAGKVKVVSLWKAINSFDILEPFTHLPSKENGIDIEGLAYHNDKLLVGFRGPVLRGNWVPIMVTEFDKPAKNAELIFVNLNGLGIRDMLPISPNQILIVAGPVGDGHGEHHLFIWNGLDCIPGVHGAKGKVTDLGIIPQTGSAKVEGITLLSEAGTQPLELLLLFDNHYDGSPTAFTLNLNGYEND